MPQDLVFELVGRSANVFANMPVKLISDTTPTPTQLNLFTLTAKQYSDIYTSTRRSSGRVEEDV